MDITKIWVMSNVQIIADGVTPTLVSDLRM